MQIIQELYKCFIKRITKSCNFLSIFAKKQRFKYLFHVLFLLTLIIFEFQKIFLILRDDFHCNNKKAIVKWIINLQSFIRIIILVFHCAYFFFLNKYYLISL